VRLTTDVLPKAFNLLVLMVMGFSGLAMADVKIEGVNDTLKSNVLAYMRLDEESCDQPEDIIRYRFSTAESQVKNALQPYGYYSPTVESSISFPPDGCWQAVFRITPGEPVIVRKVNVALQGDGSGASALTDVIAASRLEVGKRLNHADYDTLKTQLAVVARERGFFDANYVSELLLIDVEAKSADIDLVLDTGPRYHFGKLTIDNEYLDPAFINRFVDFKEGEPFDQRTLRRLQTDLTRGEYFGAIDINLTRNPDHSVDVLLKLSPGRRFRYGIGLGYGTDTGPIVRGDWIDRRINRRGHRLEFATELSPVIASATLDYRIPSKRPQRDSYSVYGGWSWRDTDAIETKAWKIGVREERFHTSRWRSNRFLEYVIEEFRPDEDWQQQITLVPGYTLTYLTANGTDRPTRGIRLSTEVMGASESVLSDSTFGRLRLSAKTILPLSVKGRLLLRGEAGWMATDDFNSVPPSYRFYAGGDNSVRGYQYQSLGRIDDQGRATGGKRLLTGSAEIDWRLTDSWSAALFTDAGNVGNNDLLQDLPWSVGFGARWYSPIGPIRVDLAFPQTGDNLFRLHISMGPDL
jgi:translocation and assembly module TamA